MSELEKPDYTSYVKQDKPEFRKDGLCTATFDDQIKSCEHWTRGFFVERICGNLTVAGKCLSGEK